MKMRNEKPKVIIKFEPSFTFKEEFLEFVEEVLSWPRNEEQTGKTPINNPPIELPPCLRTN